MIKNTNKSFSWLQLILVVFFVWHTTIPALGFYTPAIIFAASVLLLYAMIFLRCVSVYKWSFFLSVVVSILGLYFLEVLYFGTNNLLISIYVIMQMGLYPLLILYITEYTNKKFVRYLFWAVLGSYLFTSITTYFGCIVYPGASRTLAVTEEDMGSDIYAMYKMANIGNLSFTYSLVLLIPQVIEMYKLRIVNPLLPIVMLIILTITILETEYTAALLLMLVSFLLILLPANLKRKHLWPLLIGVIALFFDVKVLIGDFLIWASSTISSDTMAVRLYDLGQTFTMGTDYVGEGDVVSRMELYEMSLNSFMNSPIWGGVGKVGGHSLFIDTLGRYGIIGLLVIGLSYKKSWEHFYKPFADQPYYGHLMFSFVLVLAMAVLNPKDNLGVLTFTIPLFALYNSQKYENTLGC